MGFPLIAFFAIAFVATEPGHSPSAEDRAQKSEMSSEASPDLGLLINRSLSAEKLEELASLRLAEKAMRDHPATWPRFQLLHLRAVIRSLELEEEELRARCVELTESTSFEDEQADWTPPLTLDPETLATMAQTELGLSPEEAVALHQGVHQTVDSIRQQDERILRYEREVLPLAVEAQTSARSLLGRAAVPDDLLQAAEFLADRRQALVALRVERELSLQRLARWVGIDLHQPNPSPGCSPAVEL